MLCVSTGLDVATKTSNRNEPHPEVARASGSGRCRKFKCKWPTSFYVPRVQPAFSRLAAAASSIEQCARNPRSFVRTSTFESFGGLRGYLDELDGDPGASRARRANFSKSVCSSFRSPGSRSWRLWGSDRCSLKDHESALCRKRTMNRGSAPPPSPSSTKPTRIRHATRSPCRICLFWLSSGLIRATFGPPLPSVGTAAGPRAERNHLKIAFSFFSFLLVSSRFFFIAALLLFTTRVYLFLLVRFETSKHHVEPSCMQSHNKSDQTMSCFVRRTLHGTFFTCFSTVFQFFFFWIFYETTQSAALFKFKVKFAIVVSLCRVVDKVRESRFDCNSRSMAGQLCGLLTIRTLWSLPSNGRVDWVLEASKKLWR